MAIDTPKQRKQVLTASETIERARTRDEQERREVKPFKISPDDLVSERGKPKKAPVTTGQRATNLQIMSEDAIWVLEQDIARMKNEMERRHTPMTDRERHGFVKVSEQLRKMRVTELDIAKHHDPRNLDDEKLAEELVTKLLEAEVEVHVIELVLRTVGLLDEEDSLNV